MRVIKSFTKEAVKVSYFELEHKYLLKFEKGPAEVTFKFRKGPGFDSQEELMKFEEEYAFVKAKQLLHQSLEDRSGMLNSYFENRFDFEEII